MVTFHRSYDGFDRKFTPPLLEKKIASCYQKPHIKKTLTIAFMKRSIFKNKANNTKNLMT